MSWPRAHGDGQITIVTVVGIATRADVVKDLLPFSSRIVKFKGTGAASATNMHTTARVLAARDFDTYETNKSFCGHLVHYRRVMSTANHEEAGFQESPMGCRMPHGNRMLSLDLQVDERSIRRPDQTCASRIGYGRFASVLRYDSSRRAGANELRSIRTSVDTARAAPPQGCAPDRSNHCSQS